MKKGAALLALTIDEGPSLVAAQPGGVVIVINDPKRSKYPLAIPSAAGGDSRPRDRYAALAD